MSAFRDFERKAIKLLAANAMPEVELDTLLDSSSLEKYEHTGVGYFVTIRHRAIPSTRTVCNQPLVVGKAGDVECGFVVYLDNGALTLECHSWGDGELPEDFRECQVELSTAPQART